jgi:urease accessory protein
MTTLTVTTPTTPPRSATAGATIAILMTMIMGPSTPTTTITTTTMRMDRVAEADRGAPLPLLIWLSPAFPVGAFAYSHGLEWAVEAGDVVDARSLEAWLVDLLEFGAPRSDAILFSAAFGAAAAADWPALMETNVLAVALTASAERRLETTAQGAAFVAAARAAWDCEPLRQLESAPDGPIAYPVAVAAAASGHDLPLDISLEAFVLAQAANLVSAGLRLGPIGQTDGQKILASLLPRIQDLAHEAGRATLSDLGGAAFRSDIAAMRHETQYSRLFRS